MRSGHGGRVEAAGRFAARRLAVMALLVAALVAALPGCGCNSEDTGSSDSFLKSMGARLASRYRISGEGVVSGGKVTTFRTGDDLRGILPPAEPRVLTKGNTGLKRVALTIDDGWNADMRILDLLKSRKVKFTAFLIGGRGVAESNPGFVKAIKDAGGEICSHTYSHYVMSGKDEAFVVNEIWKSQDIITRTTREVIPYVRFSGGASDANSLAWTAREGYWVVNWSIDSRDTADGVSVDAEVAAILSNLSPGGIILCHWGGHNTYEVLARAIPEIQGQGYEVTSLTRVMEGTPCYLKKPAAPAREKSSGR